MNAVIRIEPNGHLRAVYSDKLPLARMGELKVTRASHVDFNEASQQWEVRWAGQSEVVFMDPSRDACIQWEVGKLNEALRQPQV